MVSLSNIWRSKKVGWMAGLNFEFVVISETLRNPKKSQDKHGIQSSSCVRGKMTGTEESQAIG